MWFERFLLAFESHDLSQTDKRITRVSSFPSFNFWMINYSYTQKSYLAIWQNCFGHFITQKFVSLKSKQFSQFFLVRGKSERIDKIHFAESSGLSCWETEKEVPLLITQFGKEDTLLILLSAWDRSRDSKAKRNLSKHMWRSLALKNEQRSFFYSSIL